MRAATDNGQTRTCRPSRTAGAGGFVLAAIVFVGSACADSSTSEPATGAASPQTVATSPAIDGVETPPAVDTGVSTDPPTLPSPSTSTVPAESSVVPRDGVDQELIDAAWANDVTRSRGLIDEGADVNYKDSTQQSAYLIATSEGYLELLELTFDNGADVTSLDSYNGTGLIRAAERGHADIVGRLLQTGIDVNHINNLNWTALHESIILGTGEEQYVDTVRLLVAGGADVTLPPRDGTPPLRLAQDRRQDEVAATLQAVLDGPMIADANQALLAAAESGDADGAALAIRAGADLEARDDNLRTPLLLAATNDHTAVARLLVALGGDPDALDDRHDTPWLVTGVTGSVAMGEILLAADPDLTILNRFGGTSLIPASDRGHVDYVRWVLGTDIDVNHVNNPGWTALMEAVLLGDGSQTYQDIVALLIEGGADVAIADRDGTTAAQHAAARGYDELAQLLDGG